MTLPLDLLFHNLHYKHSRFVFLEKGEVGVGEIFQKSKLVLDTFPVSGKRQTVLFSATQTKKIEDLAKLSLKRSPLYVGVDDHKETSTVEGLEQVNLKQPLG